MNIAIFINLQLYEYSSINKLGNLMSTVVFINLQLDEYCSINTVNQQIDEYCNIYKFAT